MDKDQLDRTSKLIDEVSSKPPLIRFTNSKTLKKALLEVRVANHTAKFYPMDQNSVR